MINQGAASSKDAEFTSLKNKVNELYAKAQGYLDAYKFDDTLKSYKTQALSQSNNHFSIKGEFDTKLASLDSILDKPNNEGGEAILKQMLHFLSLKLYSLKWMKVF
ncbi:TPA_asm: hypothetical protein GD660_01615 [Campylobacter jejuni]|nr:hypothetical protein [Campylobacter jejuni]